MAVRTLKEIKEQWKNCRGCSLQEGRHNTSFGEACPRCSGNRPIKHHVVVGEGSPQARIVLVGEAPGEWEDKTGVPFIGESGDILTLFLNNAGLLNKELTDEEIDLLQQGRLDGNTIRRARSNIFITNLVGCRPPENRDPNDVEMSTCWPRVAAQIYAIDPLLIIALGRVAARFLLGRNVTITEERGLIFETFLPGLVMDYQVPVLLALHPAYLMRNADKRPGAVWNKTHDDFERARDIVEMAEAAYRGEDVR